MKSITLLVLSLFAMNILAQQTQTEAEMYNTFLKAEKKAVVAENMTLTDEQAVIFWPIYEEYQRERGEISHDKGAVAAYYLENFGKYDGKQIDQMVNATIYNQIHESNLMKKYYKKIKKALDEPVALRFFMIEEQLQLILKVQIWEAMPLVETYQSNIGIK